MNSYALVYRRVSTDHQDNSLQVQEHLNDEYAHRSIIEVLTSYEDEEVSGSVPFRERAGGRALWGRLQRGDITDVITAKQDRLGRDTLDMIATVRAIWEMGVTPHFTSEGGAFPRTPQNELLFEIKASVAQYERNLIRERTTVTLRHKASKGELIGTVPFGFDCRYTWSDGSSLNSPTALTPGQLNQYTAHGTLTGKQLIPNPAEQQWIHRVAAWRNLGQSFKSIAEQLNAAGVTAKKGGLWQCGQVDSLLKSRSAQAVLRTEPVEVQTPALEQAA
jgi:putative DNA-invertase from lambdoid prophage Rac